MGVGEVKKVWLTNSQIDETDLIASVRDVRLGGVVTFTGEVRAVTGPLSTSQLIYEAHETMALKQMEKIAEEAAQRWDAHVSIAHRLGELIPGDIAVVCIAACAHRADAFDCCRYLIDRIKEDVPIWKKEFGPEGEAWISGSDRVS